MPFSPMPQRPQSTTAKRTAAISRIMMAASGPSKRLMCPDRDASGTPGHRRPPRLPPPSHWAFIWDAAGLVDDFMPSAPFEPGYRHDSGCRRDRRFRSFRTYRGQILMSEVDGNVQFSDASGRGVSGGSSSSCPWRSICCDRRDHRASHHWASAARSHRGLFELADPAAELRFRS